MDCREKLDLTYPCRWEYKVIGADAGRMAAAVEEIVPGTEFTLSACNSSRTGKYCSLLLTVVVADESARLGIFQRLKDHPDVTFVL